MKIRNFIIIGVLLTLVGCTAVQPTSNTTFSSVPSFALVSSDIVPQNIQEFVIPYSKTSMIDPYIIYGIIKMESDFEPNARAYSYYGLMQLSLPAARSIDSNVSERDLFIPKINVHIGILYFQTLLTQFNNNNMLAIAAYNAGSQNVATWLQNNPNLNLSGIPYKSTRNYIQGIIDFYALCKKNELPPSSETQ